jgi:small subunit ribosomal protein S1
MVLNETAPEIALEPKTRLSGKIVKTTLAGALVDVGQPLPGVLHISQLQKDPVKKVEDVLHEGQAVDVWVRRVRKDRIELTMIEPLRFDWKEMQPEMVVKGKVVRLETYGAFVDIGAERPGMIHISELARGYVKDAKDVVKEGDEVEAMILSVDVKKRQIRLSLKSLQPEVPTEEPVQREAKRTKRAKKADEREIPDVVDEPNEPQLTVMQLAWQAAQDRAKSKDKSGRSKRHRAADAEQEEILSRTLEKRVPTGA